MPIYEYQCQACEARLEVMQKISDAPLIECPKCQGRLEKQWSQTSFQLKGSGWYVSDYGKGGAKPAAKSDEKKADKAENSDATPAKSDDASAKKSDAPAATPSASKSE